jgi:hypothetical protein
MRKSSVIILCVCAFLAIYVAWVYVGIRSTSKPEFKQQDAQTMLNDLADAFQDKSTNRVLSFASPDALVAGRKLEQIRTLLGRTWGVVKDPKVEMRNLVYTRTGDTVKLNVDVTVLDMMQGQISNAPVVYAHPIVFTVKRRSTPHLAGLIRVDEWKITDVDARIPDEAGI